jgi:Zn-dependent protease with chaperone function
MAFLLVSFVSWRNEFRADRDGAKATGPEGLISVFEMVMQKCGKDEGSETHPPFSKRIQHLKPYLDEPEP